MPEMIEVVSSNIHSVGYDEETETFFVTFKGGKTYSYDNVSPYTYNELMDAESVGKFFNQFIKNQFVTRVVL
jgi:hypothetical protein